MSTRISVVDTHTLLEAVNEVAAATCGKSRVDPDLANPGKFLRYCGNHDYFWPDGRSCCRKYDDLTAALMKLSREVIYNQVGRDVDGDGTPFTDTVAAIAGRHSQAVRGPYFWHGNTDNHQAGLCGNGAAGVQEVITTTRVTRDPNGPEAQELRGEAKEYGYDPDKVVHDWAFDTYGTARYDERLALNTADDYIKAVEEQAVYAVARNQGLPDTTPRSHEKVYRADICNVNNPNGKFLAATWSDIAWLLGEATAARAALERVTALLPERGTPRLDADGNFDGMTTGPASAHRSLGGRAYSDAGGYCSEGAPCELCQPTVDADLLREALGGIL